MKNVMTVGAALLLTTTIAQAGGLDRSGQGVGIIFEDGNVAELTFGQVTPEIDGTLGAGPGQLPSGNIAGKYTQLGFGVKTQINEQLSFALIIDQPYGASVEYDTAGFPLVGGKAEVESTGLTALVRYQFDDNFSVHGGLRRTEANGIYRTPNSAPYESTYSKDSAVGYVIGGAYERPEIALRVAVTYNSAVDLELDGSAGDLSTTMPESVNLDFQTGIAADTLVFGSVRWVAWDGFALTDSIPVVGNILEYDDDVFTYNIGIGRRITDQFSASLAVGYESSTGDVTGNLGPTDGYISYQLGGAYDFGNGLELSGGVRYVVLGDATTTIGSEFEDNSAVALGMKVAYSF